MMLMLGHGAELKKKANFSKLSIVLNIHIFPTRQCGYKSKVTVHLEQTAPVVAFKVLWNLVSQVGVCCGTSAAATAHLKELEE
jgi:hypothetical protein